MINFANINNSTNTVSKNVSIFMLENTSVSIPLYNLIFWCAKSRTAAITEETVFVGEPTALNVITVAGCVLCSEYIELQDSYSEEIGRNIYDWKPRLEAIQWLEKFGVVPQTGDYDYYGDDLSGHREFAKVSLAAIKKQLNSTGFEETVSSLINACLGHSPFPGYDDF